MLNENELMMKMCVSENGGVGVEVDGLYYFYENFGDGDPITRIYKHFGMDHNFKFYSMCWAHQKRIKEFMSLYKIMVANNETERAEKLENVIAKYISKWSHCDMQDAAEQIKNQQVRYSLINQPKRSTLERQPRTGRRGSDDGRPERENMKNWTMEQLYDLWRDRGYTKKEAQAKAEKDYKEMHRKKSETERHQIMQEMLYN